MFNIHTGVFIYCQSHTEPLNLAELVHWQTDAKVLDSQLEEQRPRLRPSCCHRGRRRRVTSQRQFL